MWVLFYQSLGPGYICSLQALWHRMVIQMVRYPLSCHPSCEIKTLGNWGNLGDLSPMKQTESETGQSENPNLCECSGFLWTASTSEEYSPRSRSTEQAVLLAELLRVDIHYWQPSRVSGAVQSIFNEMMSFWIDRIQQTIEQPYNIQQMAELETFFETMPGKLTHWSATIK